jgi:endonuclease YncB( thermonuclease family)
MTLIPAIALIAVAMKLWRYISRPYRTLSAYSPLVIDGDTIFADGMKYRIHGIDAPEIDQSGGQSAKKRLVALLNHNTVQIEITDVDRYGRKVARLYTTAGDIGLRMVETGYARAYFHDDYTAAEGKARRKKRGLWGARGGMPDPAAYRRQKRGTLT